MKAITLLADIVNNSKTETIMIISKTQYTINDLCFEAFKFYDNVGVKMYMQEYVENRFVNRFGPLEKTIKIMA